MSSRHSFKHSAPPNAFRLRQRSASLRRGPSLGRPHADTLKGGKVPNLKGLIIQHAGNPYRVIFVFDPRRTAILLLGGQKTGKGSKWYKEAIPKAQEIYKKYLKEIEEEGLISDAKNLDTVKERNNE